MKASQERDTGEPDVGGEAKVCKPPPQDLRDLRCDYCRLDRHKVTQCPKISELWATETPQRVNLAKGRQSVTQAQRVGCIYPSREKQTLKPQGRGGR